MTNDEETKDEHLRYSCEVLAYRYGRAPARILKYFRTYEEAESYVNKIGNSDRDLIDEESIKILESRPERFTEEGYIFYKKMWEDFLDEEKAS